MLWVVVLAIAIGGIGLYVWSQRRPLMPGALPRRAPLMQLMNLRRSTLLGCVALLVLICLGTAWGVKYMLGTKKAKQAVILSASRARGGAGADFLSRFPKDYRTQQPEEPVPTPQPLGQVEAQPVTPPPAPPAGPPAGRPPPPPKPPPPTRPTVQAPPQGQPAQAQAAPARSAGPPRAQPVAARQQPQGRTGWWWFPPGQQQTGSVLHSPFAGDPEEAEALKREQAVSKLFPPAVWEEPKDKYKVLYWDQRVHGVLAQNISSDFPGVFVITTDEDVMDRWGHGHVILPRYTSFLGAMQGESNFGQEVIPASISKAIFPDGRAVAWGEKDGQVGAEDGSNGIPADVNNHYVKLAIGIGISALLSMGPRIAAGSPSPNQFQPNLPQEFAQQAASGASQQMQQVIQRQFMVKPTLTQKVGTPVTIQFTNNVSFQTAPRIVDK